MAGQVAGTAKTMRKKLFHEPFFIGHSYQAVAQIAGGNDIQVFTDTPSRTAIVGHGDDSRQIISLRLEPRSMTDRPVPPPMTTTFGPFES